MTARSDQLQSLNVTVLKMKKSCGQKQERENNPKVKGPRQIRLIRVKNKIDAVQR